MSEMHVLHNSTYKVIVKFYTEHPSTVLSCIDVRNQDGIRWAIENDIPFTPRYIESLHLAKRVKYYNIDPTEYCKLAMLFGSRLMLDTARICYPTAFNNISSVWIHASTFEEYDYMRSIVNRNATIRLTSASSVMLGTLDAERYRAIKQPIPKSLPLNFPRLEYVETSNLNYNVSPHDTELSSYLYNMFQPTPYPSRKYIYWFTDEVEPTVKVDANILGITHTYQSSRRKNSTKYRIKRMPIYV